MLALSLSHRGRSSSVRISGAAPGSELFAATTAALGLDASEHAVKLIWKGKQLSAAATLDERGVCDGGKLMVISSQRNAVEGVNAARSDPTVRGFAAEDAREATWRGACGGADESPWGAGAAQDAEHKFCRFEPCTWQSFGTRPSDRTPHAFAARQLLVKLATDPGIVSIMVARAWVVGTLAEMDPIDDRLKEKMEGGNTRLLGYNQNGGALIAMRLRTPDLTAFEPYDRLVDTLLHELSHNEVGPHNEHFWHLFCQLKVLAEHGRVRDASARRDALTRPSRRRRTTCAHTPPSRRADPCTPAGPPRPTRA